MTNHLPIAIIGAGASGLMAANLVAERKLTCTLFESHMLPGGCASWFRRETPIGRCGFDVGATVVPSFTPDSWWYQKLDEWNLVGELGYTPSTSLRFDLDGRHFEIRTDPSLFFIDLTRAFPEDAAWIDQVLRPARDQILSLKKFVETLPQWPIETPRQFFSNIKKLKALPGNPAALKLLFAPFDTWLGANKISAPLRTWFEMNALISIQCPLADAYAMYALFAILFHSTGSGTFDGGMRRYFEVLLKHFRAQPEASYRPNTKIMSVSGAAGQHRLLDSNGMEHGPFAKVFFSCPRHLSEVMIGRAPCEPSADMWSAVVLYLVVADEPTWTEEAFNWHTKSSERGEEIFASFSRRNDLSRSPLGYRCVNVSHHEALSSKWFDEDDLAYRELKQDRAQNMLAAFQHSTGIVEILHLECATPRTWQDYTQRPMGTVGGVPLSRRWTLFNSPQRRLGGASTLIQIGDTSFPGQSLYACAMSAGMAIDF